ncbi:MAG: signal peptidase II [Clostridia bacterium]|nr:signal peptidase II [Clostridia bacterium]
MVLFIVIIIASIILDQASKIIVMNTFSLNETRDFIKGIINFRYIRNEGAAWGMLSEQRWIFIVITIIACCIIPYFIYKYRKSQRMFGIALSLVLGGALGNLIDRVLLGSVTDFIEFSFFDFPIFNIADSCVTVGAALLIVYIIFFDKTIFVDTKKKEKNEKVKEESENDNNSSVG